MLNGFFYRYFVVSIFLFITSCGGGNSGSDTTSLENTSPISFAGNDQTVDEQTLVTLLGSGTDTDGSITSFSWLQTAGTSVTIIDADKDSASFTAPDISDNETLTFQLTVTDNGKATASDIVSISIKNINKLPISNAGNEQTVDEQTSVMLLGSGTDTDGSITSFSWLQTAGTLVTIIDADKDSASFTAPDISDNETLTFQLTVTDNEKATASDIVSISIKNINKLPISNAGNDQTVDEQTSVMLLGSGTDTDGSITNFSWLQIAGTSVTIIDADKGSASFIAPDISDNETLTFQLTVTDNDEAVNLDLINVAVVAKFELITDIYFPDENLAACVNNSSEANGWSRIDEVFILSCPNSPDDYEEYIPSNPALNIENIKGIEHLTSLTNINLNHNSIEHIGYIANLPKLEILMIENNKIKNFNGVVDLPLLNKVWAGYNDINDFEGFPSLDSLEYLSLIANKINSFSGLPTLPKLKTLDVDFNEFINLNFDEMPNLPSLIELNLANNQIANIVEFNKLMGLQSLNLSSNKINELSVISKLISLESLDLTINELTDISPISKLINLKKLELSSNQVSDFSSLLSLSLLELLSINNNKINNLSDLNNLNKLNQLYITNNNITDLSGFPYLSSLTILDLQDNQISDVSTLPNIELLSLNLNNNLLQNLNGLPFTRTLSSLRVNNNQLTNLSGIANHLKLDYLMLRNNNLIDLLWLPNLTSITRLYLDGNSINDLSGIQPLTNLWRLGLNSNFLINISPLYDLQPSSDYLSIDLRDNNNINCDDIDILVEKLKVYTSQLPINRPFHCL